jgi:hypothetical protein
MTPGVPTARVAFALTLIDLGEQPPVYCLFALNAVFSDRRAS